jgi:hypothetical protein
VSRGTGGWTLDLACVTCSATETFRGVLLTFAGDEAIEAGWAVSIDLPVLIREPGQREETCPKCTDALRG